MSVTESTANLIRIMVKGYVENGRIDIARELVEAVRIVCDEATASINEAARTTCQK